MKRGFTLLELLIVMAIIMILMSLIVGVGIFAQKEATRSRAKAELQELHNALQTYRIDTGSYPDTLNQEVRNRLPAQIRTRLERRDTNLLLDPWKRPFVYRYDLAQPETYVLFSKGPLDDIDADDIYSGN